MIELFSLGKIYPSDFLKPDEQPRCDPVELKLIMDDDGFVFLNETAEANIMWGERYWYSSSVSDTMKDQLKDIVHSIVDLVDLKKGDLWVDVAGNSGYMLFHVPDSVIKVSVDPVGGAIKREAETNCDLVIQDYFSAEVFQKSKYGKQKANVITGISFFYDLENPGKFLYDVFEVLDDNGLFALQMSYSPLMLQQLEFSNLCHEHIFYYSLFNIKPLLEKYGYQILDVQLNNCNAGSFRLYMMKKNGDVTKFGSQTHRDVCNFRINSLLAYEETLKLDSPQTWFNFYDRINALKKQTVDFIKEEKAKGKTIYGYGASTKFNTTIQYFGLDSDLITAIADRSEAKHGLRTVGSNIPVISEQQMREKNPDYLLVGPAHFISEFKERERALLKSGTKFIVTMPSFRIITKDDI